MLQRCFVWNKSLYLSKTLHLFKRIQGGRLIYRISPNFTCRKTKIPTRESCYSVKWRCLLSLSLCDWIKWDVELITRSFKRDFNLKFYRDTTYTSLTHFFFCRVFKTRETRNTGSFVQVYKRWLQIKIRD